MKSKILVIVGPTASGKSDLAVQLAQKCNGEIISADSRQVYRGLDAGSGKITKKEMLGIPHHLLNVANPKKQFSVAEYKKLADQAIIEILKKGKLPIIVGGTGFYIDAVTKGTVLPEVPPNRKLRKELEKKTAEELFALLQKQDRRRAQAIDKHNKVRLVRALEIVEALGTVPEVTRTKSPYQFVFVGLKPIQEELEKKIYARIIKRLPSMIREAKKLHADGLSYARMEELGLEYRYLARLLQGKLTKKELFEELYVEIKKYSKRQMTWFKVNKEIKWFESKDDTTIDSYIKKALGGR